MSKKRKRGEGRRKSDREKKAELIQYGSILSSDYSHHNKTREIIEWFREGLTDKEIFVRILQENPKLKESSAKVYLNSAKSSFKEEYILDRKFNIIQHVRRYDKDILTLSKYEPRTSSYYKYQQEKSEAYLDMVNLLQKKERVLGFHRKATQIKIKNNVNLSIKTKQSFDFSNLSWEEKKELYNFVMKCYIDPNEKLELKPNPNKKKVEIKTEEVEHEEVDEEANVNLIEEKEEKLKDFDLNPEEVTEDKNIIDATADKKGKDLDKIKNSILNNLLKS